MDNMRSHHTQTVKDLLEQAGVQYLYLPPYSLDLNPIAETGDGAQELKHIRERFADAKDFVFQPLSVQQKLIYVVKALAQLHSLLGRNRAVYRGLNLGKRSFATSVHELCNIEMLTGMFEDVFGHGPS